MPRKKIPFNQPYVTGAEGRYIAEAIEQGCLGGNGLFTKRCQSLLEAELGAAKCLLTTSCTDALEMAALLLDISPGDEVVLPSFTFVSTVNAFVLRGARPVFVDIRPDTLNLDERELEKKITPRTKAIVPVHYAGVGCEMDVILDVARRHGVVVVEDNAHGLFGKYRGKYLGTFGQLATLSFHETKNFSCGEGGALILNDPRYIERAEILREKGTNRSQFFRGQVDKYTWVDIGSSFLPADLLAVYLFAQLERREWIQAKRRVIWETYHAGLSTWAPDERIRLPIVPDACEQAYHLYYVLLASLEDRQRLLEDLKAQRIFGAFHYVPLHLSPMGQRFGYRPGDLPVTERVSDCLVRLPFFNALETADQQAVLDAVRACCGVSRVKAAA